MTNQEMRKPPAGWLEGVPFHRPTEEEVKKPMHEAEEQIRKELAEFHKKCPLSVDNPHMI